MFVLMLLALISCWLIILHALRNTIMSHRLLHATDEQSLKRRRHELEAGPSAAPLRHGG